jgi:hypothetical protein
MAKIAALEAQMQASPDRLFCWPLQVGTKMISAHLSK